MQVYATALLSHPVVHGMFTGEKTKPWNSVRCEKGLQRNIPAKEHRVHLNAVIYSRGTLSSGLPGTAQGYGTLTVSAALRCYASPLARKCYYRAQRRRRVKLLLLQYLVLNRSCRNAGRILVGAIDARPPARPARDTVTPRVCLSALGVAYVV